MNWKDPARAEQLKRLWNEGHSCAVIARMIGGGITRNAVIGAVSRAGLPTRAYPTSVTKRKQRKSPLRPRPQAKPISPAAQVLKAIRRDGLPLPPPQEYDKARVSFLDLEPSKHCRWPVWTDQVPPHTEPSFCGLKPVLGLSYCEVHAARAFNPPNPRRREQLPVAAEKEFQVA